jgi:ATP-binding cassette, subfamily B, multidrug efflux pump
MFRLLKRALPDGRAIGQLRTLLPYLRRYLRGIGWGLVLVVVSNFLFLAVPYWVRLGIDALEQPGTRPADLRRYALWIVGTATLGGIARYGMRELLNGISRKVETDLRNDFFAHLLRLDAGFYDRTRTGDVMSRATNDIQAVRMVAGPAYMYLVNTAVMAVFAVALMIGISPALTGVALLPLLLLPPVTLGFGQAIHARFEVIQEQMGRLSTMVQENLSGVRIVKAYGQEAAQVSAFRDQSAEYLHRNLSLARVSALFYPTLGLLSGAGLVLTLWLGGRQVMEGRISVGDFVAFQMYLAMLAWPMIALGWVVNLFQRGAASMGRINHVLWTEPALADPVEPVALARVGGALEFRDVAFRYPGSDRAVLREVSFRLPAGATLAVVGPTGSGKTTLVHLLARVYDPTSGRVLLDDVPVDRLSRARLHEAIGLVPQDGFLFSDTILNNLALGVEEADEEMRLERVRRAARVAQLESTIAALPDGYATRLGERGINLSGGQKQRATLARAVARDPHVLVLDDALSAVDTHTEHDILAALRAERQGRTNVIVSHRVSAVMDADLILVLDDGHVVERGTHVELLAAGGLYAALQRRQLLAETLEDEALLAPPSDRI